MKNLTKFFIVSGVAAVLSPFALIACDSGIGSCTDDTECGADQTCDLTTNLCVGGEGEGEGEGDVGEGEGEGGGDCAGDDGVLGTGTGDVTLDAPELAVDDGTTADCGGAGGDPYALDFAITGEGADADTLLDNTSFISFESSSAAPAFGLEFCNGGAVACVDSGGDALCVCGRCRDAADCLTDLAIAVALHSSALGRVVPADLVVFGEVGLVGELRGVSSPLLRLREAERHGFRNALVPASAVEAAVGLRMGLTPARSLREALGG